MRNIFHCLNEYYLILLYKNVMKCKFLVKVY